MKKIDEFMAAWERNYARTDTNYAQDVRDAALEVYGDEPEGGGEMPEPWAGCGVEYVHDDEVARVVCDVRKTRNGWRFSAVGTSFDGSDVRESEVTAIYDGRRCIWRRKESA